MAEGIEKMTPKQNKSKGLKREDLLNLDKKNLVDKILQLEAHNEQLKNIINKNSVQDIDIGIKNTKRKFDFVNCHYRRVLLHILYFGWDYQGLAVQEDSKETIEHYLFHALKKSCLIESRETSQYNRCGRTDKGVSAFQQVISITLRSNHPPAHQFPHDPKSSEIPYCKILNRLLPKEIRVVSWMPIPEGNPTFSARFDCKKRLYKYYFPKSSLDINAMRDACQHLIGSHDFRNLCKMDVGNGVTEFRRNLLRTDIKAVDEKDRDNATSMYTLTIEGTGFLWHQIRCIMGVLLLVGQGHESPTVIKDLLNVEIQPRKPQYSMALDVPLNLFHCSYDIDDKWIYDEEELRNVISHLQNQWTLHSIKTAMIKDSLQTLETIFDNVLKERETKDERRNITDRDRVMGHVDCLLQGVKSKVYIPLLKRVTCSSLEERIEYYRKKRRVEDVESNVTEEEKMI